MPKSHEVAAELRKLADALDQEPDTEIVKPTVCFAAWSKQEFLAAAKIITRPSTKCVRFEGTSYEDLALNYVSDAIEMHAVVPRRIMCTLLKPAVAAVYDCDPILSLAEEDALEATR